MPGFRRQDQLQLAFQHVEHFAETGRVSLRIVALARRQGPRPQFHLVAGGRRAQQYGLARLRCALPHQHAQAVVRLLRRLHQVDKGYFQGGGHVVEVGQADVGAARLDAIDHAPAESRQARQLFLAEAGSDAQAPQICGQVCQHATGLGLTAQYIAPMMMGNILLIA